MYTCMCARAGASDARVGVRVWASTDVYTEVAACGHACALQYSLWLASARSCPAGGFMLLDVPNDVLCPPSVEIEHAIG